MASACYNVSAAGGSFQKLDGYEKAITGQDMAAPVRGGGNWGSTHPSNGERIKRLRALAQTNESVRESCHHCELNKQTAPTRRWFAGGR